MNKLKVKTNDIDIEIETTTSFTLSEAKDFINQIQHHHIIEAGTILKPLPSGPISPYTSGPFKNDKPYNETSIQFLGAADTGNSSIKTQSLTKDRLPNREKIRLEELKIKAELDAPYTGFRCPNCHQATLFTAGDVACIKPLGEDVIYEAIVRNPNDFHYLEANSNRFCGDITLIASEDVMVHCPCCQKEHSTKEWIECYNITTDGRHKDEVCDLCGFDKVMAFRGAEQRFICDNEACPTNIM